ncbi:MAG: TlpA family protein disulfide reductase [Gammaproteobacteria bacterium]|nr:TlpA family protein disulfide reductase [Gammaproteobacteria bacterium]
MMNGLLRLGLIALAGSALVLALHDWRRDAIPAITVTSLRGETVRLAELRGRPLVVTFWASDCRTCLLEIPEFDRLSRDYAPYGVRVLAVAMAYDLPSRVLALVRETGLGYTVVLDSEARLAAGFGGVKWVPSTFVIDPEGNIRHTTVGAVDFRLVRQQIEAMLGGS